VVRYYLKEDLIVIKIVATCAVVLSLSGCMTYKYDGKTYHSKDEAVAAERAYYDRVLSEIKPLEAPVAQHARFCIPSSQIVYERATHGGAAGRQYVAETIEIAMKYVYDSLQKRRIFTTVDFEWTNGDHVTPTSGEDVIYFYLPEPKTGGYYFLSDAVKRTPVTFDRGNPDPTGRMMYFLDSVQSLASIKVDGK
jgi:hypothetical protein